MHEQKTLNFVKKKRPKGKRPTLWSQNLRALNDLSAWLLGINRKPRPDWRVPLIKVRSAFLERWTRNLQNGYNVAFRLTLVASVCVFYGLNLADAKIQNEIEAAQQQTKLQEQQKRDARIEKYAQCAGVLVHIEAGNQKTEGVDAAIWVLVNRANVEFDGDLCAAARDQYKTKGGKIYYAFSALNRLFKDKQGISLLSYDKVSVDSREMIRAETVMILNGKIPDLTNGATFFLSKPGCEADPRFRNFEECKASFIRANNLVAAPVAVIRDHWFFRSRTIFVRKVGTQRHHVRLPLPRPNRFVETGGYTRLSENLTSKEE